MSDDLAALWDRVQALAASARAGESVLMHRTRFGTFGYQVYFHAFVHLGKTHDGWGKTPEEALENLRKQLVNELAARRDVLAAALDREATP